MCSRCESKNIPCVPGRQEVMQSLSITVSYSLLPLLLSACTDAVQLLQMERKFIFEDGRRCFTLVRLCCYGLPLCSIPKQGRPRSDTVQTSDSVVSPSSAGTDNVRNQDNSHNASLTSCYLTKVFSPTSPLFQTQEPLASPTAQSPTADVRCSQT